MMERFVGAPGEPTGKIAFKHVVQNYIQSKEQQVSGGSITRYIKRK